MERTNFKNKKIKAMTKENTEKKKEITPSKYFDFLKGAKKTITLDSIKKSFDVFIKLGEKYQRLGQVESLKKLCFLADTLQKEEKLIELGVTTYVYKDVIEDYITNVADKTVKIIELSRYMREIPDELIETIEKTKELFDELYVVFTDYTGKEERKVEKERRDKDPILFGVFKNRTNVADRFYFIGDWVDEYCDLTLDKMVEQYKEKNDHSPVNVTEVPQTSEELVNVLKTFKIAPKSETAVSLTNGMTPVDLPVNVFKATNEGEKKHGFFSKVRSIFKK